MIEKFSRVTSSGKFIPEIDGLRFLAIIWVVLYHAHGYFITKVPYQLVDKERYWLFTNVLVNGDHGVELFFVISGLILGLPFAEYHINKGSKVDLKSFYIRRVTRLEPPYIFVMVMLFVLLVITKKYDFLSLVPHLGASLLYLSNIIYERTPLLTVVAWSLEIEIQFYLLMPLIAFLFKIKNSTIRRLLIFIFIILFPLMQTFFPLSNHLTLYNFINYFLTGVLLADFYTTGIKLELKQSINFMVGLFFLTSVLYFPKFDFALYSIPFMLCIFILYFLVLSKGIWREIFRIKWIVVIGGMCYSIYLLHYTIISFLGRFTINYHLGNNYIPNLLIQMIMLLLGVLLISGIFFYYIEKPCMNKYWPRDMYMSIKEKLFNRGKKLKPGPKTI